MKQKSSVIVFASAIIILFFTFSKWQKQEKVKRILIFSKTEGYRHKSIEPGKIALYKLGNEMGFHVDTTESEMYFNDDSLKRYSAVIFLNTTLNVLNAAGENGLERFIQAGGGFVGIHAASDTEFGWPWYGKLVGAYFVDHPRVQEAKINVVDKNNVATSHLPETWTHIDEWYNFRDINPNVNVLLSLDESSYKGGKNGASHPIAWYHEYDGGRAFYTGLGHTAEVYSDPLFLRHLSGGIRYAVGGGDLDYSKVTTPGVPEDNRFVKTVLTQGTLTEPTELTVLPDLDLIVVQRRGEIMHYNNKTQQFTKAGALNVYFNSGIPEVNAEEGLMGVAADPDFARNGYLYIYYSPADTSVNRLSRFTLKNNKIDPLSERMILQFYSQRQICCHTGGSLTFGSDGLLYLSTGDNSTPFKVPNNPISSNGFAPLDNRPGFEQYDARRTAGNSNDLRGKIIRIRVKEDGSYEIPDGNLFPMNTSKTRPEIYVMGNRNPYRISVDQKTNYLYWGEVGPDAPVDSINRGPRGYDEINQARKSGFFGWPFFIANNIPYISYDYTKGISGKPFDPAKPRNNSFSNTGLEELPAAHPAFIWYPYGRSKDFPDVGQGGRTSMVGPVYYSDLFPKQTRYPDYFDGKLLIYDWVRGWVKLVRLKPAGDYDSMEPFLQGTSLAAPIDMEIGPDGRLYVLEYGKGWFSKNPDAGVSRIDYLAGNRPPIVKSLTIKKPTGLLPYKLIAEVEAVDPDKDSLSYRWAIGKGISKVTQRPVLKHTFTKPGTHAVSVTVFDPSKSSSKSEVVNVTAGNEAPKVNILIKGNKTFYFPGKPVNYQVFVTDNGAAVDKSRIYITSRSTEGTDLAAVAPVGHKSIKENYPGKAIMLKSNCNACHQISTRSVGPSFTQVSKRYQSNTKAVPYLTNKIIKGGAGAWGQIPMPAHAAMQPGDAKKIAEWVLSISAKSAVNPSLPLMGKVTPPLNKKNTEKKTFNLHAFYTDRGSSNGARPLSASYTASLINNVVDAGAILDRKGFGIIDSAGISLLPIPAKKATIKFNNIDLAEIVAINLNTIAGGDNEFKIEVRADDINVIGTAYLRSDGTFRREMTTRIPLKQIEDKRKHRLSITFIPVKVSSGLQPLIKSLEFVCQ